MRLAFWIASKNLAFRRIQSAAAMLGVAVGIATVCAVQIVDYNTIRGAREHHRRHTGNPDLVASVRDQRRWAETGVRAHLERRDEVDLAMPIFESSAIVATSTGRPAGAQLTALDMAAASEFDPWRLASGSAPAGAREALIGARLAEEIGASTGETIALRRPAATATGCVEGEIVVIDDGGRPPGAPMEFRVSGVLAPRYLGSDHRGRIVLVPYASGIELMEGTPVATRYWIRCARGVDPRELERDLAGDFSARVPFARQVAETPEEAAFRSGVRLAAFLALGLGLLVIFHLINLSVTSWVRQAGLLGALGVPSAGLGRVFLAEAILIAGGGVLLGTALGIGLAWLLVELRLTTLGFGRPLGEFAVPLGEIFWVPLLGALVSLLGAVQPIARIRRVSTLDALERGEAALGAPARSASWMTPALVAFLPLAILLGAYALRWVNAEVLRIAVRLAAIFGVFVVLLAVLPGPLVRGLSALLAPLERRTGFATWMARRNLSRSMRRFAASIMGLSLVAAALVSLHAITGGLKSEINDFAARAMPGHLYAYVPRQPAEEARERLRVQGVTSVTSIDASYRDGTMEFRGVAPAELWRAGALAGRPAARLKIKRGEAAILSERAAREAKLEVGDHYRVTPRGKPLDLEVVLISDAYGYFPEERSFALIAANTMREVFCITAKHWSRAVIAVEKPEMEREVRRAILQDWRERGPPVATRGRLQIATAASKREELLLEVDADFAIFDVILLLTGILGGLGLMNSLIVSGLERTRELGLLRAVGVPRRGVARMFILEAGLVGLAGALLGVLMGIPFGLVSVKGLSAMTSLSLPWHPQLQWSVFAVVAITAVAVIAAFVPAARAGRADVISAIKSE